MTDKPHLSPGFRKLADVPLLHRVQILADAAAGLGHLHAKGVLHHDVKPANILLKRQPRQAYDAGEARFVAKVSDLGVSKYVIAG